MNEIETSASTSGTLFLMSVEADGGTAVFLPDVGGNVFYAKHLVHFLGEVLTCYGIKFSPDLLSNLEDSTVETICSTFAQDILAANLPKPIYLIGFSFGSLFAFETARQMGVKGKEPDRTWILDMPVRPIIRLKQVLKHTSIGVGRWMRGEKNDNTLRKLGYITLDLSSHPKGYRSLIRSLYSKLTSFRPSDRVGNLVVVRAQQRKLYRNGQIDLGWANYAKGNLEKLIAPGNHLNMVYDKINASEVAKLIIDNRNRNF